MRVVLLLGIIVFLEIVACSDVHNNKVKKGHKEQFKLTHQDKRKNHKSRDHLKSLSPHDGQKKFDRYLEKWVKFSDPGTKWQQANLKKKDNKKMDHVKKAKKNKKELMKEMKHKRTEDDLKKKSDKPFSAGRRNTSYLRGKLSRKNQRRNNFRGLFRNRFRDSMRDQMQSRYSKKQHEGRKSKKAFNKHLKHADRKLDERSKSKFENRMSQRELRRDMHQLGLHAFGPNKFARRNNNHFGRVNFCSDKRQIKKCPDVKREVCGSDGKTYQNRCLLIQEMCKKGKKDDLKVLKRGACAETKILH